MSHTDPPRPPPAPEGSGMTPLKRAFLALEDAQARLQAAESASREPLAVIGVGCRVPGDVDGPDALWALMRDGQDAIGPIPADRWDADALYDPDPEKPGRIATRAGGFLRRVDLFDPGFFAIAPREAQGMDPQQRLLLEVAWEALEHAGQAPDRLEHSATGVYVGLCSSDYTYLQLGAGDPSLLDAHFTSGIAHSVASGRISYLLGLQGPSLTIDTACSSSLVAIHQACQALRNRECRMALAGGVNLILSPDLFIALSHARFLAPDGRCKTFDAAADGFSRGEGCGMVVLKRLSDAQADGDRILAVIRSSAVNQDGPSSGLTAPNGPAQEAVIREAISRAGITPAQVGYVEAHGTGTQLGDPLEVQALGAVFGDRGQAPPLWLGSVKTNLGHLEAAAGVTGLIKVVLALRNRQLPAHLHFRNPSPHIPWADLPLRVPTRLTPWEPIDGRRIGGVSSFGFSGTNAHVILEEAPLAPPAAAPAPGRGASLVTLSARDERALAELAARHAAALAGQPGADLADVAFTANAGRAQLAQRAAVLAHSTAGLRDSLLALAEGRPGEGTRTSRLARRDPPRIAFLFTGQGAQYAGMARGLYAAAPVFREVLDRCAEALGPHLPRPLLDVIFAPPDQAGAIDETAFTQPALFSVEVALAELWRSWGVVPSVVMGHSIGEYAAAHLAGVLSLDDALRLVAVRGRLMQSLPSGGAMAAIFAPEERVLAALAPHRAWVALAAVNGPAQAVISGRAAEVESIGRELGAQGVRVQPLPVSHAFHSPLVDPILDAFEREAAAVRFASPRLRLISNLTGRLADPAQVTQARYWRRHVREAVAFGSGLRALGELRPDFVVEVGPHPTLLSFASATLGADAPALLPSLRKGRPDWEQMQDTLGALYLGGVEVDWRGVGRGAPRRIVDLPTYPFQRERFWFQARPGASAHAPRGRSTGHPLLGTRLRGAGSETTYEASLGADSPDFVRQHRVLDRVVLPATAYLEALLAAGHDRLATEHVAVEDVTLQEAMLLEDDGATRTVQLVCAPVRDGAVAVTLSSLAEGSDDAEPWTVHATATLRPAPVSTAGAGTLAEARARCREEAPVAGHYAGFARRGLAFGDGFQVVRRLWRGESEALGEIELGPDLAGEAAAYRVHPVLLDGCLQTLAAALPSDAEDSLYLPMGIGRYVNHRAAGTRCTSHAVVAPGGGSARTAAVLVFDADGALVAEVRQVQLKRVSRDALSRLGDRWLDDALYETAWRALPGQAVSDASLPALAKAGGDALEGLRRLAGLEAYDAFLPALEGLCVEYVQQAMSRLGWAPAPGEPVREDSLAERLRVAPRHRRLFRRLLAILVEAGWLSRGPAGLAVVRPWGDVAPQGGLARLRARFPSGEAELEMTGRTGAELCEALRGERDPMQLLFPGGSLDTAVRLYRDSPTARLFNGLVAEVVAAEARARAGGRPLRILEIGGGTGGSTAHVAPRLPTHGVEYVFTDVGPLFVARAREHLGPAHPFMRFQVLDLERDPEPQGLATASFDLVIASNVVHATTDLSASLGRIRRLLAPGGLLAMLEVTAPQRWFDLTVGLTDGWWAFSDLSLRPDYPTLPRDRWLGLLSDCGFDSATALPEGTGHAGALGLQSLFLARAGDASAATAAGASARRWAILSDRGGVGAALAERLRALGDTCTVVPADEPLDLARLRAGDAPLHGVIHARSLDATPWEDAEGADLALAEANGTASVLGTAQQLIGENPPPRLWIVTRGAQEADPADRPLAPAQAPEWGLARTVRLEHPELRCTCVDLDPAGDPDEAATLAAELARNGEEGEVALRPGGRRALRLVRHRRARPAAPVGPYRLAPSVRGDLDTLRLDPLERRAPGPGEVEIAVEATGLNFKDVLNVLGMYPGDPGPLGGECAGRVVAVGPGVTHVRPGDDVLAVAGGSFASHVIAGAHLVARRPAGVTAEEGAAFPIAFVTAQFCLDHLARLRAGERVLVHAAAGGVGLAAVQIAQRAGAEVFATAGAPWKRALLRELGVAHVLDSRSAAFADEVLALTGGQGVDVVLDSLSGDLVDASFRAIARGGRFVEIGKRGVKPAEWVAALGRDIRYSVVDWGETAAQDPALVGGILARLVEDLGSGALRSLPRHTFGLDEAARAFRVMAQARHAGKVVIRHGAPGPASVRRDGTYLVTGGLSGLGPVIARWLADRGAGRIVLVGRRGPTEASAPFLEALRAQGAEVVAEAVDVTDEGAVRALLRRIRTEGAPLRGVIHGAGVLDDAALLQQDPTRLGRVLGPKVRGSWILDRATRGDPLDWFVLFSSAASVLGSPGQANHAAANAFLDLLARERAGRGLPSLSIDWGPWIDVGAAADRGVAERVAQKGIGGLTPAQGLMAMERLLADGAAQVAVLPVDWHRYLAGKRVPAFLSEVVGTTPAAAPSAATLRPADLKMQLAGAPRGQWRKLVQAFVRERAMRALRLDPSRPVDPRTPLGELGLDSLLAVELRNTLGTALGKTLPATLLFDYPTLDALTEHLLVSVLGGGEDPTGDSPTGSAAAPAPSLVSAIEDLSDEEVERQLAARSRGKAGP
jgi:acyl transferase domain-containing protein/NADPH:quinone reductase-like Zn-dependent oxidoreductase